MAIYRMNPEAVDLLLQGYLRPLRGPMKEPGASGPKGVETQFRSCT